MKEKEDENNADPKSVLNALLKDKGLRIKRKYLPSCIPSLENKGVVGFILKYDGKYYFYDIYSGGSCPLSSGFKGFHYFFNFCGG